MEWPACKRCKKREGYGASLDSFGKVKPRAPSDQLSISEDKDKGVTEARNSRPQYNAILLATIQ